MYRLGRTPASSVIDHQHAPMLIQEVSKTAPDLGGISAEWINKEY
jgi:hypothetical protein